MVKKYGKGMGWYGNSRGHSLARRGISTKKTNPKYAKNDLMFDDVEFEPTTISIGKEPSKEEIMKDADEVFTNVETKSDGKSEEKKPAPTLEEVGEKAKQKFKELMPKKKEKEVGSVARPEAECPKEEEELVHEPVDVPDSVMEIREELDKLEGEGDTVAGGSIFSFENIKDKVKNLFHDALDHIQADSIEGFEQSIASLEEQKINMEDKVHLLNSLKNKMQGLNYDQHDKTRGKLDDISRVNKLLAKPNQNIKLIDNTINDLNIRKKILLDERNQKRREWVKEQERIRKLEREDRGLFGF